MVETRMWLLELLFSTTSYPLKFRLIVEMHVLVCSMGVATVVTFLRLYDGTMNVTMVVPLKGGCCYLKIYVTVPIMFEKVEVIEDDVI